MKILRSVIFIFLVSCTNNSELKDDDQGARDALVGVWRGAGEYHDDAGQVWNELWKMARYQDGKFEVSFLLVQDDKKQYGVTSVSGKWFYENGKYYEVDEDSQKTYYNVYSVKKDRFEYNFLERSDKVNIEEIKTVENYQLQDPPQGYTELVHQPSSETE